MRFRSQVVLALVAATALMVRVAHAQESFVTPPKVVTHVEAVYPPSALQRGTHADVTLLVTVDVDGHVSRAETKDSGGADLDEAATVAVRQWTFLPAMRGTRPVASRIRVSFHFAPPAPPPEIVLAPASTEPTQPPTVAVQPVPASEEAASSLEAEKGDEPELVHVYGKTNPPSVGASDFNLHVGHLANVPRQNASELLKLAPGILLTNEGGEGHAEQVFLRGFDAREGQDIEFTVGGVPINESGNLHGNGYADVTPLQEP